MEYKYTTDGRKVVVIGNLNSVEKIVQEIFIVDGSEIPSGEHFTTKSLHDAPAVSWKESKLKELEDQFDKDRVKWEKKTEELNRTFRRKSEVMEQMIRSMSKLEKELKEEDFETIVNLMSGKITHLVLVTRWDYKIVDFMEGLGYNDSYHGTDMKLRLMSFFGNPERKISIKMNDYSDGSGNGWASVLVASSYQEAVTILANHVNVEANIDGKIHYRMVETAEKYGFNLPAEMVVVFKMEQLANLERVFQETQKSWGDRANKELQAIEDFKTSNSQYLS